MILFLSDIRENDSSDTSAVVISRGDRRRRAFTGRTAGQWISVTTSMARNLSIYPLENCESQLGHHKKLRASFTTITLD